MAELRQLLFAVGGSRAGGFGGFLTQRLQTVHDGAAVAAADGIVQLLQLRADTGELVIAFQGLHPTLDVGTGGAGSAGEAALKGVDGGVELACGGHDGKGKMRCENLPYKPASNALVSGLSCKI